jgi:arginase
MNASLETKPVTPLALTLFLGRVGDRNSRGMDGANLLGRAIADRLRIPVSRLGDPRTPLSAGWEAELEAARPELTALSQAYDALLGNGSRLLTIMGRCATGLATLPQVARHRPDACIVWFDAHGDANTPATSTSGYLGGLVLAGAAGNWDSGLGSGLAWSNIVLVGARDLDPPEIDLINAGILQLVAPGADLARRLAEAVGRRPVYVHVDCDVLDPGLVPTEYSVEGGLSFADLRAACETLARSEVVGLEVAEFEGLWLDSGEPPSPEALIDALQPLLNAMR